jgi:uncharacterized protein YqhQ
VRHSKLVEPLINFGIKILLQSCILLVFLLNYGHIVENQDNRFELKNGSKMCCHRAETFGVIGCEILELLLKIQQLLILPVILPVAEEHRCWASLKSH